MEGKQYIVNVEVIVVRGGEYLMTRRSMKEDVAPGMLSFPGGKVEGDDGTADILEQTAARELMEETGISADNFKYVASKLFLAPDGQVVLDVIFTARYCSGTATVHNEEELESVFWLTEQALLNTSQLPPWTRESFMLTKHRVLDNCFRD